MIEIHMRMITDWLLLTIYENFILIQLSIDEFQSYENDR